MDGWMKNYSYIPSRLDSPIISLPSLYTFFCTVVPAGEVVLLSQTGLNETILLLVLNIN